MSKSIPMLMIAVMAGSFVHGQAQEKKTSIGPDLKDWESVTNKAIQFVRTSQDANGGWSTARSPGISGVVLTGALRTKQVDVKDPMALKALKYIENLANPKEKHLAGKGAKVQLQNYVTSINVMALVQANQGDKYKAMIGDAVEFLKKLQWDEGEGKNAKDDFYGGAGYDSKSRPDLSNTQMFLDALKAAGLPKDDPALKKALVFVKRCQNFDGEGSDQAWSKKIDDGSFIYTAATGGVTKVGVTKVVDGVIKVVDEPRPDGSLPGYGSMTYAGIKSLIYCGVDKNDKRVKKAYEWIEKNYTVDKNPGMPDVRSQWGMYYYYHTMAKCLDALGVDYVVDAKGVKHDWRKDITQALAKRQLPNGSFSNPVAGNWMENDANLDTGYALMALSYCRPK